MDHHLTFGLIYGSGLVLAAWLSWAGARRARRWARLSLLALAVLALWFALWLATDLYYGIWQSMPDPPEEAFADGAQLVGTLLGGWILALPICLPIFALSGLLARRARRAQAVG